MATSFKRSHAHTATLSVPNPAAGHRNPRLHGKLLDTHKKLWVFCLWGHCFFYLGPGVHKILFVPSKSLLPQFCSNYRTIALISHTSKVMLKILQASLQQYVNFEMFKLDLEKGEEPEIKSPTSVGSSKMQKSSRKTFTSALLTTPKPLTVWITTNCGKF